MTQLKTLSTQEEIDEVNIKINSSARDIGLIQHNIQKYQEDVDKLHLTLKNCIVDLNKLTKRLEKEKAKEIVDPPLTDACIASANPPEAQDVVQ